MELSTLTAADAHGYDVLDALTPEGRSTSTFSRAHTFVCVDGRTYWVKGNAQQGLVCELIGGRLAMRTGAGPAARVVRVTPDAVVASGGSADHLIGVVVGIEDQKNCVNSRDLQELAPNFEAGLVDAGSRALVVAFQTWIGVGDVQVLLDLSSGRVYSIDHGECFAATSSDSAPSLTVLPIPGVPDNLGSAPALVAAAVARVESVTDQHLVEAVTRIPLGENTWKSPVSRRLEIAKWLASRREQLRQVMMQWR